jgi:hypothetical protein
MLVVFKAIEAIFVDCTTLPNIRAADLKARFHM